MTGPDRTTIVHLPGGPVSYLLRRSPRARTIRLTIHPDHGVVVTVPARVGAAEAERRAAAFVGERAAWVRRHLARHADAHRTILSRGGARDGGCILLGGELHRVRVVPAVSGVRRSHVVAFDDPREVVVHRVARERRADHAIIERWLRERAQAAIQAAIDRHAPALGVVPQAVGLRDPRTRWGSASRTGRLSFSWRLILAPPAALETVVVHELAHLRVFGHGAPFWALVATRRPDHAAWRRWLHDHAMELHRALEPGEA